MANNNELYSKYPWINKDLFIKVLQCDFKNCDIIIEKFTIEAAIPEGENFTSQLIRAIVTYNIDKKLSHVSQFIIKAALCNEQAKSGFESMKLFEREIITFQFIIPEVNKLLQKFNENVSIAPRCYETNLEKSYMIFEDLTLKRYCNEDQTKGLSMEHFKCMFSKLARWHAATVFLQPLIHQYPELFDSHQMQTNYIFKNEIKMHMEIFAKLTETMPGFENISKKISIDKFYNKVQKSFQRNDKSFTTFCHGDLWSNNVMFRCNDQNLPTDAIFVDFQFSYWGAAVTDITNILYTSSKEYFRENHWNELIQYYHKELNELLHKFNYSGIIPTLNDLHDQIILHGISSVANGLYEFSARGKNSDTCVTDIMGDLHDDAIEKRLKMVESAKNNEGFKFMLRYFDQIGYFD